jgi:transposase
MRFPTDLAWAQWPVTLHLKVKRFFCRNPKCPKRTFAEQFPQLVARYARRTKRVMERQQRLGVNVCARIAEKLLKADQMGISDTTLNRMLRMLPDPEDQQIRILGVDDWAKRKGQRYGTILVDLEGGQVVDLLEDRSAESLVAWLGKHPEIEIVSRDRSQTYAEAIRQGAAQATQVADRWHLLKNASEALFQILQPEYSLVRKQWNEVRQGPGLLDSPSEGPNQAESLTPAEQRRRERIETAQQLHSRSLSQKDIALQIQVHPKTIRRYLRSAFQKVRRRRKSRLLDAFQPYLLQRWNEGCHNAAQLFREIQAQGFEGHHTIVLELLRQFRQASGLPPRVRQPANEPLTSSATEQPPSLRTLTYWLLRRPEQRKEEHEKLIERISAEQPKLATTISQARALAAMIRERKADQWDDWLAQASESEYRVWRNFAAGLKQDGEAVQAALRLPWSNGPTEGHINRLKCLKRQMYGRAKDDLLRKRVLWQGKWGFT